MRFTLRSSCIIAVVLCNVKFSFETEDLYSPKKSTISRRAIDGTRGRKYYDPAEDGFFDDYNFDGGQYEAAQDRLDLEDIRRNVPGEPGVDYPAYQRLPQTSFTCGGRARGIIMWMNGSNGESPNDIQERQHNGIAKRRGYYADEEAGCQLFHVCDEVLVSSFLCPIGSVFSQKLLTCDWWNKVDCSLTRQFYEANRHIYDQDDDEMLRKAYAMTSVRLGSFTGERKDRDRGGKQITFVTVERTGNDLPSSYEDAPSEVEYRGFSTNVDYSTTGNQNEPYHQPVLYSHDYHTKAPKIYQDSPIVRIHKVNDHHGVAYETQTGSENLNAYHRSINEFPNEFQPSYAPTVPTVTTTMRRFYSPTVPTPYRSSTPSYDKFDQSFQGSHRRYTHRDDSQILPTAPTIFYRDERFHPTPNPVSEIQKVHVTNYSHKSVGERGDYEEEFDEDMEVRESIGLAQSQEERSVKYAKETQSIQDEKEEGKLKINATKIIISNVEVNETLKSTFRIEPTEKSIFSNSTESVESSEKISNFEKPSINVEKNYFQQSIVDHPSSLPSPTTQYDDVLQSQSIKGVKTVNEYSSVATHRPEHAESTTDSVKTNVTVQYSVLKDSESLSTSKSTRYTDFEHIQNPPKELDILKPAEILEPPETNQEFRISIPEDLFNTATTQKSNLVAEFSTIEYKPFTSVGSTAPLGVSFEQDNFSNPTPNLLHRFTTPSPLPVSHLPTISIPATEITPPFTNLFAGGYYGNFPVKESQELDSKIDQSDYYNDTVSNSSLSQHTTKTNSSLDNKVSLSSIPFSELQPPVYNHRLRDFSSCCDNDDFKTRQGHNIDISTTPNIREESTYFMTEMPTDLTRIFNSHKEMDTPYKVTVFENVKHADITSLSEDDKYLEKYRQNFQTNAYTENIENYPSTDYKPETTTETDFPDRVLNLFQIMAELAKTNRFPRPFTHNEPLTINLKSTTEKYDESSETFESIAKSSKTFSHTQKVALNPLVVQRTGSNNKKDYISDDLKLNFEQPVYGHEYRFERLEEESTGTTLSEKTTVESDISINTTITTTSRTTDAQNVRDVVETEFIPSLGFHLNTEQGRNEFAEAVRRGLFNIEGDNHKEFSTTTANSTTEKQDKIKE